MLSFGVAYKLAVSFYSLPGDYGNQSGAFNKAEENRPCQGLFEVLQHNMLSEAISRLNLYIVTFGVLCMCSCFFGSLYEYLLEVAVVIYIISNIM